MAVERRTTPDVKERKAFTDLRTVVIFSIACFLSVGAGAAVLLTVAAAAGTGMGLFAGISASGAAAVLMIESLDRLISRE